MGVRNIVDSMGSKPFFVRAIDRYFARNVSQTATAGFFRPSGISDCARFNLYCYIGVAKFSDFDVASIKRMERGTRHHDIWLEIFKKAGLAVRPGKRLEVQDPCIKGTPDWIVSDGDGLDWLIEWKSTSWFADPSWEQTVQWSLYSYMTGVHQGYIVKEDPASWDLFPIKMKLEDKFIEHLLDWLRNIEKCAVGHNMLERDSRCGNEWNAVACDLYSLCHSKRGEDPWRVKK